MEMITQREEEREYHAFGFLNTSTPEWDLASLTMN